MGVDPSESMKRERERESARMRKIKGRRDSFRRERI